MAADCRDSVPLTLSLRNIAAVVLFFFNASHDHNILSGA